MKGLRLCIMPFAPDQSGACAVLYELGGITVIVDAGGCAGNVCGFDEPRWFRQKSLIFSAGLRDMDAILGRDELLLAKLVSVVNAERVKFAALVGTPVPAVIATDYRGLKRLAAKKMSVPLLTVNTDGTALYDAGASKAYVELFSVLTENAAPLSSPPKKFTAVSSAGKTSPRVLGVLGTTPLDTGRLDVKALTASLYSEGWDKIICYGSRESGLEGIRRAGQVNENLVVAPSGLAAARYLQQRFGTPYRCAYPLAREDLAAALLASTDEAVKNNETYHTAAVGLLPPRASERPTASAEQLNEFFHELRGKRVLIIHQQILANALRDLLRKELASINFTLEREGDNSCRQNEKHKLQPHARNAAASSNESCADIVVATWFILDRELAQPCDVQLTEEDQFIEFVRNGRFDFIIGDLAFKKALPFFNGSYINLPHFAVSGKL